MQRVASRQALAARRSEDAIVEVVRYLTVPVFITAFVSLTGTGTATIAQTVIAFIQLQVAWASWLSWKAQQGTKKDFPLFAIMAGMFWLAYGLPLFWSRAESWRFAGGFVSAEGVFKAQVLVLLGTAALYTGMHLGVGRRLCGTKTLELRDSAASPKYVIVAMLFGVALRYLPSLAFLFGGSLRQVFMILRTILPLTAYAILLRRSLMRRVPLYERAILVLFVLSTFLFGLSTGWLGTGAAIIMVTGCVLVDAKLTIPKAATVAVFAYILFLQPAKEQFRSVYWSTDTQSNDVTRASDWLSISRHKWESALSESDSEGIRLQVYGSMSRFSLLQQAANVMDLTPSIIPHQGWKMYSYMAYTLIPRALWKDKPTVNDANRFYQVTYGITTERALDGVSIAVGVLTESYISFGWFGAVVVMSIVGIALDCVAAFLLAHDAGMLLKGLGMSLLPGFVSMESQMAQYLGGLAQQIFLTLLVMMPVAAIRDRQLVLRSKPQPLRRRPPTAARIPKPRPRFAGLGFRPVATRDRVP